MHWQVSDLVDRLASEERTALVFVDEYGHRRDYSFAEVAAHSQRYAAVLRAFGVTEGDRVFVCVPSTAKCIFAILALERLGAIPVLDESESAGASTVIANRSTRGQIDSARERFSPDARYVIIGEEREGWARLDTLAQVATRTAHTPPQIDETALSAAREHLSQALGAQPSDVVWWATHQEANRWFEEGVAQMWLIGCATVVHNAAFDARERLDLTRELDVSILLQNADEYHAELALPDPNRFKMPRLRSCRVLGEGWDELLETQWSERFGVPLTPYAAVSQPR